MAATTPLSQAKPAFGEQYFSLGRRCIACSIPRIGLRNAPSQGKILLIKYRPIQFLWYTQFVGVFLFAWIVGVTETHNALLTIILITVTFAVLLVANGYFAQKNAAARAIEAGYVVAMALVMVICQGIF